MSETQKEAANKLEFVEIHSSSKNEMMQDQTDASINIPEMEILKEESGRGWFGSSEAQKFIPAKATVARDWINNRRQGLKPWREFAKTDKFRMPSGVAVVGQRLAKNVEHFQSNYLCVFVVLLLYCILTSPMLLIALVACFGMLYVIKVRNDQKKLSIGGKELSPVHQYALVALVSFPLFYIAGAGSAIFWVIGASIFFIILHALFYASEAQAGAGFIQEEV